MWKIPNTVTYKFIFEKLDFSWSFGFERTQRFSWEKENLATTFEQNAMYKPDAKKI